MFRLNEMKENINPFRYLIFKYDYVHLEQGKELKRNVSEKYHDLDFLKMIFCKHNTLLKFFIGTPENFPQMIMLTPVQ